MAKTSVGISTRTATDISFTVKDGGYNTTLEMQLDDAFGVLTANLCLREAHLLYYLLGEAVNEMEQRSLAITGTKPS